MNILKPFLFFVLTIFIVNCHGTIDSNDVQSFSSDSINEKKEIDILDKIVFKNELILNQLEGKWYYNNQPYNGYSVKKHPNDTIAERLGFYNGKREGIANYWSENGKLRRQIYFNQNKLVNYYKAWWENGQLSSESFYVNGKKQGIEKEWYPSGQISKCRNLKDGNEIGMQKAWLKDGTLYVNYEAKNGRVFGLRRANSCYKLEDEKVIVIEK